MFVLPVVEPWMLDLVLAVILIASLAYGYRSGFVRGIGAILGLVIGAIAGVIVMPLVVSWVPDQQWRTPASLGALVLLVLTGSSIGVSLGERARRTMHRTKLRTVDRMAGSAVNLVASALVMSVVFTGVASLGIPFLAQPIAASTVLRTIDAATPATVRAFIAEVRASVLADGIPVIVDAFGAGVQPIPDVETGTPALQAAARSVVRVTGNAIACGQNQSGSGVVISTNRIITNAHVVAGVSEPVVQTLNDGAVTGRIVYFDPVDDLAVIAVDGLPTPRLTLVPTVPAGTDTIVDGYPFGGPFRSHAADVVAVGTLQVADIYGKNPAPRQVYTLAADVQQGESGGALLTESGAVAGIIFAKGATTENVGYALAMEEVIPVASQAASLSSPVSSGDCISG